MTENFRLPPGDKDVSEGAMPCSLVCPLTALAVLVAAGGTISLRAQDAPKEKPATEVQPLPPSILNPNVAPIDLPGALRLAGLRNPEIMLARERVLEAVALHQFAAVQ